MFNFSMLINGLHEGALHLYFLVHWGMCMFTSNLIIVFGLDLGAVHFQ